MKKPLFNKICIVGVGLIGGSLGLAIKKRGLAKFVVGVVRRDQTAQEAMRLKALDVATKDLKEGVKNADLVILCAPVSVIAQQIKGLSKFISPNTVVMDVGSSKVEIQKIARKFLDKNQFVGAHPMAGSEKQGVGYANANLFLNSTCFVTSKNNAASNFWKLVGAKPIFISPEKHDEWVSVFSYLPHALAFSIFQPQVMNKFLKLNMKASNPSIQEPARLALSDAKLWADIFISNPAFLDALKSTEKSIHEMKQAIYSKDVKKFCKLIANANYFSKKFAVATTVRHWA